MTQSEAGSLMVELARAATRGGPGAWAAGARFLAELDGRSWRMLDQAARGHHAYDYQVPARRTENRSGVDLTEPTGFVAAITSFHPDGRIRQGATRALAGLTGAVPSTALAVRLFDHVGPVREEARAALLRSRWADSATAVLDVLLAARDRQYGPAALLSIQDALFAQISAAELVEKLLAEGSREVRRWAFALGRDRDLFTSERLLSFVRSDPDQWLRATAAEDLRPIARSGQLRVLLATKTVETRLIAITHLPDEALSNDDLLPLLADPAQRIREQAGWRARRRGIDVLSWYRTQISGTHSGRARAGILDGLAAIGSAEDLDVFTAHLRNEVPRVRAAAITGVSTHASREAALTTLAPLLLDPSPRVSSAAARALIRLSAPREVAAAAWASPQPWSRRSALRVNRALSGWDRVEADLRAVTDSDPQLVALGLAGIGNWLRTSAPTLWTRLGDGQRDRIQGLLAAGSVNEAMSRAVAFHARIRNQPPSAPGCRNIPGGG